MRPMLSPIFFKCFKTPSSCRGTVTNMAKPCETLEEIDMRSFIGDLRIILVYSKYNPKSLDLILNYLGLTQIIIYTELLTLSLVEAKCPHSFEYMRRYLHFDLT